jgi:hypothetical protein
MLLLASLSRALPDKLDLMYVLYSTPPIREYQMNAPSVTAKP